MIHVVYALYDPKGTYAKFIGASICSIFENTSEKVTVHILCDETLTNENCLNFGKLAATYKQEIKIYPIKLNEEMIKWGKTTQCSPGTLYRLLIPDTLSDTIEKVIYLDADTIVNLDIKELYDLIENDIIGAVLDLGVQLLDGVIEAHKVVSLGYVKRERYFNSGILTMNLKNLRQWGNLSEKSFEVYMTNPHLFHYMDQCLLNYFFSETYKLLPYKFNRQLVMERSRKGLTKTGREIYHYVVHSLDVRYKDPFDELFWQYFIKTPWFNAEFLLKAFKAVKDLSATYQQARTMALFSSGRKIFFGMNEIEQRVAQFKKLCNLDNIVFLSTGEENENNIAGNLQILFEMLADKTVKNTVFICSRYQEAIKLNLSAKGFLENEDFFDGRDFFSSSFDLPLVKAYDNAIVNM